MNKSKKFINYLDEHANKNDMNYLDYNGLMYVIENQYYNNIGILNPNKKKIIQNTYNTINNDQIINNNKKLDNEDKYAKKNKVNINKSIYTLTDLIDVINTNEYCHDTEYNIDLESLHKVKKELVALNDMIGMETIKQSVLDQMLFFIQKLDIDINGNSDYKHTVIYGPPGTGKTEIAKLIGNMYSKLGILNKNVFKKVTRSDLIAGYLGQTAIKTNKIIDECIGGVLFIDEAYSLASNDNGDSFSKECLDTLCEKLSDHKNDLMVIIAGYEDELKNTFFKVNKGLESRFIWKFNMDKYDAKELQQIFNKKVLESGWKLDCDNGILNKWFEINYKDFVNYGRDMEQLLTYIKISHGKRIYGKDTDLRKKIIMDDIKNAFKIFKNNREKNDLPKHLQNFYI
jgi:SpoVK/Ycf46/Vps4 family AAA+-type ATPase